MWQLFLLAQLKNYPLVASVHEYTISKLTSLPKSPPYITQYFQKNKFLNNQIQNAATFLHVWTCKNTKNYENNNSFHLSGKKKPSDLKTLLSTRSGLLRTRYSATYLHGQKRRCFYQLSVNLSSIPGQK